MKMHTAISHNTGEKEDQFEKIIQDKVQSEVDLSKKEQYHKYLQTIMNKF